MIGNFLKNNNMNNLEQFKNHIEYNGYTITNDYEDGSCIANSERYGPMCIVPLGDNGDIGIRVQKLYPIDVAGCTSNVEKMELYDMVNEINKNLAISKCTLEQDGLIMSYPMIGYDKSKAAKVLEGFHLDCEQIFNFDLERFWTKQAVA